MFYDPKANIVLVTKDGYEFRVWDHFLKAWIVRWTSRASLDLTLGPAAVNAHPLPHHRQTFFDMFATSKPGLDQPGKVDEIPVDDEAEDLYLWLKLIVEVDVEPYLSPFNGD
jgi:hypothetical protein